MKDIQVSIVMPVYNSEKFLDETIQSVLKQDYQNWELLAVDDCSSDSSYDILSRYASADPRIRIFKNSMNLGVSDTRNRAIKDAEGGYMAFLDSDDLWAKDKLSKQVSFMQETGYRFTFTSYQKMNEDGSLRGVIKAPEYVTYKSQLISNMVPTFSAMLDLNQIGKWYFDKSNYSEDLLYWLKILKENRKAYSLPEVLGYYRVRLGSRSSNKREAVQQQWKIIRCKEEFPPFEAGLIFLRYLMVGFGKYIR